MKEFYTVGEISRLFKVSKDTLRYYDKIGLLRPWMTGENSYRYYSKAQFEMISSILLLRSIGTPIAKLQTILCHENASLIEDELHTYIESIDDKIRKLQYTKKQVNILQKNIQETCYSAEITLEQVPKMYALLKEYDSELDELDMNLIQGINQSKMSDWISYANLMSTSDKGLVQQGEFHTYKTYGYLSEVPCPRAPKHLYREYESRWCVCCNARVERIDHLDIDVVYQRMLDYIQKHHYEICDDVIERNVLDLYGNNEKNLSIFFRIYIPVMIY